MPENSYEFYQLDDTRFGHLQYIFWKVFRKRVTIPYLRAKYDTSWTGVKHLCFLAYQDDQPVAFYGAIPQVFVYRGERFLAAHTCDSFTMPNHQRKGLHKALALRTYEVMRAAGVRFVYAFHSENTYYSCKKLDWKEGVSMRRFMVKTGGLPWGKVMRRLPVLRQWHAQMASKKLGQLAADPRKWRLEPPDSSVLKVAYEPAFFAYKSFTPNAIFELGGARFWMKLEAVIAVGDVQFETEQQLVNGLSMLRKIGRQLGLSDILFQCAPSSALSHWLEAHFIGYDSWLVGYLDFVDDLPLEKWEMRYGDLDTF